MCEADEEKHNELRKKEDVMGYSHNGQFGIGPNGGGGFDVQLGAGCAPKFGQGAGAGLGSGFGGPFGQAGVGQQMQPGIPRAVVKPGGQVHQEATCCGIRTDINDGSQAFLIGNQSGQFRPVVKNGRATLEVDVGPMRYDIGNPGNGYDYRL